MGTKVEKPLEHAIWAIWLEDLEGGGYEDRRAAATIRELQAERDRLREFLRGWQNLLEDGPVNCGDNDASDYWETVNGFLTGKRET